MTLAETQALFHEAITSRTPLARERLEACFAGTPDLPAAERVAIYANMYLWRLVDALRETFPKLVRQIGDERFAALAEDYLRRTPSDHHDIGRAGRLLAPFLRQYPDPNRPDLGDLAELEWVRQEVFSAPPVELAGPEAFAALTPEGIARTGLVLSPALRVLVLDHAVAPLWRRLEDGAPPEPPSPGIFAVAVWRSGFDVFHAAIPLDEAVALEGAAAGDDLARVCAAFADRDDPAAAAHAALSSWLEEGWIVAVADRLPARQASAVPARGAPRSGRHAPDGTPLDCAGVALDRRNFGCGETRVCSAAGGGGSAEPGTGSISHRDSAGPGLGARQSLGLRRSRHGRRRKRWRRPPPRVASRRDPRGGAH
jgi:hypothetical protein